MSAAQNLPSHSAEMMRNALPDQLLQLQTLWLGTLRVIGSWLVHPPSHLDVACLPLVPVLEDVTPCQPEVALPPAGLPLAALLAAARLHRNLRRDARSPRVARSRLRFSSRHTETAQRLGVALNQSDITLGYHQLLFQTSSTTCLLPRASSAARARPWWAPLCRTPGCSWSQLMMSRRLSLIFYFSDIPDQDPPPLRPLKPCLLLCHCTNAAHFWNVCSIFRSKYITIRRIL